MVLGLLLVDVVEALALDETVDEGTSEASEDLFSLGVAVRVSVLSDVVLVCFGSLQEVSVRPIRCVQLQLNKPRKKQQQRSTRERARPCGERFGPEGYWVNECRCLIWVTNLVVSIGLGGIVTEDAHDNSKVSGCC